jgi:tetratricopeptide (TPR) repeat protein
VATGERLGEANVLNNLGNVAHYLGDYPSAKRYYDQSVALRKEIGDRQGEGEGLTYLSLLYHHLGDQEFALDFGLQALEIVNSLGDRHLQGYTLTHLGHALASLQMMSDAAEKYRQAVAVRRELGEYNRALEPLAGLARIALSQGNLDEAQTFVEEILGHLEGKALDGAEEPFRVYLTCYQVLSSAGQDSRARTILNRANELLQEQAANLPDKRLEQSFLKNVAAHREIIETLEP